MSSSWLIKQRKQTLLDLSSEAGLPQDEDLRKDEIVENLEDHLQANATRLSRNSAFEGYFGTRRTPFKARSASAATGLTSDDGEVKSVVKGRGRRTTKVKSEIDELSERISSPSNQLTRTSDTLTPATSSRGLGRPRTVIRPQLPPSPADIADDVEYTSARLSTTLHDVYSSSGITEAISDVREALSSVTAVQTTLLFFEALALQREILPWKYAFDLPSLPMLGIPAIPVVIPDLFLLLTSFFWSTSLLWATTNIFLPAAFGYFYNLSTRTVKRGGYKTSVARYSVDPLVFNVVKALLDYVIYEREYTFGLFDGHVSYRVEHAMFGGSRGMLIGSAVGVVASLYEAAQVK